MLIALPKGMTSQQYSQRPDLWPSNKGVGTQQKKTSTGSPFATGQAQSQQSPYATSTPYKKNPAGDFAAYAPQQQKFGNTTLTQTYSQGASPFSQPQQAPTGQTDGNWGNYVQGRPDAFTAQYGNMQGGYSSQPNYQQRDAFIQALNNQYTPYMTGQATGQPQFNPQAAWDQASQMVQNGWQNPFAPNLAAQAFPSQYAPSNLTLAPSIQPTGQPALSDIQRRLSTATTQQQMTDAVQAGMPLLGGQPSGQAASFSPGLRAWAPGDPVAPPSRTPQKSRYRLELDRIEQQGGTGMTAGRNLSANEQQIADAFNRGLRDSGELARSRDAMMASQGRWANTPSLRQNPNMSQMVAGRIQSTGATGYGYGSGQGGRNPGAIGMRNGRPIYI